MTQQSMPNPTDLYEAAAKNTQSIIAGVEQEQLSGATPCSEWDVQGVINHLLDGTGYISGAISGQGPQPAPKADSLAEAYAIGASNVASAMRMPGALDKKVQGPAGEISSMEFAFASFMDALVHGWDIAKATGQNTELPQELVEVCAGIFTKEAIDKFRGGPFGPAVEVPESASTQDKMLGTMGRKP